MKRIVLRIVVAGLVARSAENEYNQIRKAVRTFTGNNDLWS
jgi:hypothetical protein